MNLPNSANNEFLSKLTAIVEANLTNPQFSVSLLAREMGISRVTLHRRVNSITKITVSQFINQVRLKKAKEILRHTSNTVSEVTYEVGFSNVSYFIKRFHEFYGYSPGEVGKREEESEKSFHLRQRKIKLRTILISIISIVLIVVILVIVLKPFLVQQKKLTNTFAVLPPHYYEKLNDSIAIDGILQEVRDNLSRLNNVEKVVPWLSVLQYRNSLNPASEIASKLKVNYVAKPKIRLVDDRIYLSITLIKGLEDKLLETYTHKIDSNNITTIHQEIIKEITGKLDISISPTEQGNIGKLITTNKKARNYYWKGVGIINLHRYGRNADLTEAVTCFENAIEHDNKFAQAYAQLAHTYYQIDYNLADKIHLSLIDENADKALLNNPELDMSWIAKALYYSLKQQYELAIQLLDRALQYNPNSELAILNLAWIYTHWFPDYEKSLEYNLFAKKLNITTGDSIEQSFRNHRLSQAFRYTGFLTEAEKYINRSLELDPGSVYAMVELSQLLPEMTGKYEQAREILVDLFQKHPSDTWVLRHLALTCYLKRDFEDAYNYYKKFTELLEAQHIVRNQGDNGRIGLVFHKMGNEELSEAYFQKYLDYIENRNSIHKDRNFAAYYSFRNDTLKAIEHLRLFSEQEIFPFYCIGNLKRDPLFDNIRKLPEFQKLLTKIETKFWKYHERIKKDLEKKELLNLDV